MEEEQISGALNAHWHASAVGDANAEDDIYDDDAICDYPQSDERILGRTNLQALRSHHPGQPSGFNVKRIIGKGDLWITEYTIVYQGLPTYTVSITEFRNGKVVHEIQYFADPFVRPLAKPMGSTNHVTQNQGTVSSDSRRCDWNVVPSRRGCGHILWNPEWGEFMSVTKGTLEWPQLVKTSPDQCQKVIQSGA